MMKKATKTYQVKPINATERAILIFHRFAISLKEGNP